MGFVSSVSWSGVLVEAPAWFFLCFNFMLYVCVNDGWFVVVIYIINNEKDEESIIYYFII